MLQSVAPPEVLRIIREQLQRLSNARVDPRRIDARRWARVALPVFGAAAALTLLKKAADEKLTRLATRFVNPRSIRTGRPA